jgi:hypothetical protein
LFAQKNERAFAKSVISSSQLSILQKCQSAVDVYQGKTKTATQYTRCAGILGETMQHIASHFASRDEAAPRSGRVAGLTFVPPSPVTPAFGAQPPSFWHTTVRQAAAARPGAGHTDRRCEGLLNGPTSPVTIGISWIADDLTAIRQGQDRSPAG